MAEFRRGFRVLTTHQDMQKSWILDGSFGDWTANVRLWIWSRNVGQGNGLSSGVGKVEELSSICTPFSLRGAGKRFWVKDFSELLGSEFFTLHLLPLHLGVEGDRCMNEPDLDRV
jgi:hypothetical protein